MRMRIGSGITGSPVVGTEVHHPDLDWRLERDGTTCFRQDRRFSKGGRGGGESRHNHLCIFFVRVTMFICDFGGRKREWK